MTTTEPMSMRYTHAKNAYDLMLSEAQRRTADDGKEMLVWEGFLTRLIKDQLQLATPYYSDVRDSLNVRTGMGCIRQLRRGGASTPSQWELIREPTEDLWNKLQENKPRSKKAIHEQQLLDLASRVSKLEAILRAGGINV